MKLIKSKKGQGSALGSDLPTIVMIVVSVGFFLASLGFALNHFNSIKGDIELKQAAVDASSAFMSENAYLSSDSCTAEGGGFLNIKLADLKQKYGLNGYMEVLLDGSPKCQLGKQPPDSVADKLTRSYPIAWEETPLDVKPAIIRITLWNA